MKIDAVASYQYTSRVIPAGNQASGSDESISFANILNIKSGPTTTANSSISKDAKRTDFTNMTRPGVLDWVNNQIRNGKMSFYESGPFLAMTIGDTELATDPTHYNFMEKAHQWMEGALSRNDQGYANRLNAALETMRKNQVQTIRLDVRA